MNREEFTALVERMEVFASANPAAYRWRVLAWAGLGYGYLLLLIAGLLAICALLVLSLTKLRYLGIKLLYVLLPTLYIVARSLWVRFEPPQGPRLQREDAPELFQVLDEFRTRLRTPKVHEVVITPELNAAVVQIPRLGPIGWYRNYLLLGLPLLKGLTVQQFQAVLAHELGHLSGGHGRVGNWIYRLRRIWEQLDDQLQAHAAAGAGLIRRFFHWYSPRFNAISFPLARANEYEADAASVQLTSAKAAAQALTGVNVLASYLDQKYWPTIHAAAKDQAEPSFSPYTQFLASDLRTVPQGECEQWQARALARATTHADTHPSLSDRLRAIGAPAEFAPPGPGAGADRLLSAAMPRLEAQFDQEWRERIAESWQRFHDDTRKARERLAELRPQAGQDLPIDQMLELADLEERVGDGESRALALRQAAVERHPDSIDARFVLARQQLQAQDAAGITPLEQICAGHLAYGAAAAEVLRDYYWQRGESNKAHAWHDRHVELAASLNAARRERDVLLTSDSYLPHGLDEATVARLVAQLAGLAHLRRVYLVRKQTRYFVEHPFYVLGFSCSRWPGFVDEGKVAETQHNIREQLEFPGETMIVSTDRPNREWARLLRRVSGARIL
ncbi:MAG: M48 family metalloprotease [Steroidobacteraceae bacterium]